jgi:thiol-disulfide isomerase/thioredoxin
MFDFKIKTPEFKGIKAWINSKPLKIEKLKGKVVLIDFWTYTCINCIRSTPFLKKWHEKYSKKGLVIIGVHSPEFQFEKNVKNVQKAVKELGIKYPVAVDSNMETWRAFDNMYWPAKYIINKEGFIVDVNFGEGHYSKTESTLQQLLGISKKREKEPYMGYMFDQSPETYAGFARNTGLGSGLVCDKSGCNAYVDQNEHLLNVIYPDGRWEQEKEYLELKKAPGKLSYRFNAREVNMVMAPVGKKSKADIFINNRKKKSITIDKSIMYNVFKDKKYGDRELSIVFHGKVRVYVYTFG